jgi:hypothetical protein
MTASKRTGHIGRHTYLYDIDGHAVPYDKGSKITDIRGLGEELDGLPGTHLWLALLACERRAKEWSGW